MHADREGGACCTTARMHLGAHSRGQVLGVDGHLLCRRWSHSLVWLQSTRLRGDVQISATCSQLWADVCVHGVGLRARALPPHTPPEPSLCLKGYVSCVVVVGTPQGGGLSVCRCANPAYPLSPTRCWRYRFSYLDFGGDCGWGRCKRPAEARCLPRCQSPHQGSRMLNPLLKLHIQTENDFPRSTKCRREFVLESHREAELEEKWRPQISLSEETEDGGPAGSSRPHSCCTNATDNAGYLAELGNIWGAA